jgi:hypothetical protein
MAELRFHREWMPQLWNSSLSWLGPHLDDITDLGLTEALVATLVTFVIQRFTRSHDDLLARVEADCGRAIGAAEDGVLFQCNPIHLVSVLKILSNDGIKISPNAIEYVRFARSIADDETVTRWQAPILRTLFRVDNENAEGEGIIYSPGESYLANFGRVLGDIECLTDCGARPVTFGQVQRVLLYAGASRAVELDHIADAGRALRCFHYIGADDVDQRRQEILFDAICARQEPEGHFGPRHGKGFDEQLSRAFECLWAIAEVNSDFRLFQLLSDYPTSAPTR